MSIPERDQGEEEGSERDPIPADAILLSRELLSDRMTRSHPPFPRVDTEWMSGPHVTAIFCIRINRSVYMFKNVTNF